MSRNSEEWGALYETKFLDNFGANEVHHLSSNYSFQSYNAGGPSSLNFEAVPQYSGHRPSYILYTVGSCAFKIQEMAREFCRW